MKRVLKHSYHLTRWTFACLVILTSLLLLAGRGLTQYVENYAGDIVDRLSVALEVPVQVDSVAAEWHGLSPSVYLEGVHLGKDQSVSSIASIVVKPDVLASLRALTLVWSRFEVTEMDMHLEETSSGAWKFAGVELGTGSGGNYLEKMILDSNRVSVQRSRLRINSLLGTEIELRVQDLNLNYALGFRRIKLDADYGAARNQVRFVAELTGSGSRLLELDGLAYLKIDGEDISEIYTSVTDRLWPDIDLRMDTTPSADIEIWANFRSAKQIDLQGKMLLEAFPARLLGYESGSGRATADLIGVYSGQSQSLDLQDFRVELNADDSGSGDLIEIPDFRLKRSLNDRQVDLSLLLPSIQVTELLASISHLPILTDSVFQQILQLNPAGDVELLHFEVPDYDFEQWTLSGQLRSVDLDSFRNAPAVRNLSGSFHCDSSGGSIELDSSDVSFFYPGVYDHWLDHESARGLVTWQIDSSDPVGSRVYVSAPELTVLGEHGPVKGAFLVDAPLFPGQSRGVDLTLYLGITDSEVSHQSTLVPTALPLNLRNWLDRSLLAGRVPEAAMIYRGSVRLGEPERRTVQVRARAENAEILFLDRWPTAEDIAAEVWVSNNLILGTGTSADLLELELSEISVAARPAANTAGANRQFNLQLSSAATGPSASALDLIRYSGLRDQVGTELDDLQVEGQLGARINLSLPLKTSLVRDDIDIQVQASLLDNQIVFTSQNIEIEQLSGQLNFDDAGLYGQAISARIWDSPLSIDLAEDVQGQTLGIDLRTKVDVRDIAEYLDAPLLNSFEGQADMTGHIEIVTKPSSDKNNSYHFWSDMVGVQSALPAPLAKAAEQATSLDVKVVSGEQGLVISRINWDVAGNMSVSESAQLESTLVEENSRDQDDRSDQQNTHAAGVFFELSQFRPEANSPERFHSARIAYNSAVPEVSDHVFAGRIKLAQLDANGWLEFIASKSADADSGAEAYGTLLGLRPSIAIELENLTYGQRQFGALGARLEYRVDAWHTELETDYARGNYSIFKDTETPSLLSLSHLNMDQYHLSLGEQLATRDSEKLDPRAIPGMQFNIDSLVVGGLERGSWQGQLRPTDEGLWIEDLAGGFGSAQLATEEAASSIFWGVDAIDQFTELNLTFVYEDVGDLFRIAGLEPPLSSSEGVFYTSLSWGGAPQSFTESDVSGIMGFNAESGAFFTDETRVPNAMLKMIGLFNVGSWTRRLKFDFRDVTTSGTPYDQLNGDFIIDNGLMTTLSPVAVELSSGSMLFDGAVDLDEEIVDARLVITLPARQNMTWVAGLVGGLPAAVGVWLAGKVFNDEFDSLSSVSYRIQGTLDNPDVTTEKMFESTITN